MASSLQLVKLYVRMYIGLDVFCMFCLCQFEVMKHAYAQREWLGWLV